MKTSAQADSRFQSDAGKYAAYLLTPEGRLRLDLAFDNMREFLPKPAGGKALSALDLGCGTGTTGIRLAQKGFQVTLLDCSQAMLEIAQHAALEAGIGGQVKLKNGDATQLPDLFLPRSFDVILCHNVLEYVDDPVAVLCGIARLLRNSSGLLSLLVRSQAGEALKAAIQTGDLAAANDTLTSEWGYESLYGGKVRMFTLEKIRELLQAASLSIVAERGVRVVSDYLPPAVSRSEEYGRILDLERKLGSRPDFVGSARYIQVLAHPLKDGA